jgi:serine protease AprX
MRSKKNPVLRLLVALALLTGCAIEDETPRQASELSSADGGVADAGPARPDLVVTSARLGPEPGVPGEPMELVAIVTNRGGVASGPTGLRTCDPAVAGFCVPTASVPSLAPGGRAIVRATLSAAATAGRAREGLYRFVAEVDRANSVLESNEGNNTLSLDPTMIVVPVVPPRPLLEEDDERAVFADGVLVSSSRVSHGVGGAPSIPSDSTRTKPERGPQALGTTVHAAVTSEAAAAGPGGSIDVVIHFAAPDAAEFPRLPDLDPSEPRFGDVNGRILARRAAIFEGIKRQRRESMQPLIDRVRTGGGRIDDFFSLGWSFQARIPVSLLSALSTDARIRSIESTRGGAPPPFDVESAIALIGTEDFYDNGETGAGFVLALLDTGVLPTHDMLSAPDRIGNFRDCVDGDDFCLDVGNAGFNATDTCNHGTSSAAIITGNNNLGVEYRGVTKVEVDSYRVYSDACLSSTTGILRGFDRAVFWGAKVIVGEVQHGGTETDSVADAADDAFASGSLVIAANGNLGPLAGTVRSPAVAHNAIGIGAYDGASGASYANQSQGPTLDARIKPDVRFPNNTDTAGGLSDTDIRTFTGTSGATPYGGATGIILADDSDELGWSTDPGRIYSMMIAFGNRQDPFTNTDGAGDVHVGLDDDEWIRGMREISNNEVDTVLFDIDANDTCIEAAVWWSDGITWHNDIDIHLHEPSGNRRGESNTVDSVFERIRLDTPLPVGQWELHIEGYSVQALASPEQVYYFVHVCD